MKVAQSFLSLDILQGSSLFIPDNSLVDVLFRPESLFIKISKQTHGIRTALLGCFVSPIESFIMINRNNLLKKEHGAGFGHGLNIALARGFQAPLQRSGTVFLDKNSVSIQNSHLQLSRNKAIICQIFIVLELGVIEPELCIVQICLF